VRDLLASFGPELGGSNPMATLHTLLKRLVAAGEAEEVLTEKGKLYQWAGGADRPQDPGRK